MPNGEFVGTIPLPLEVDVPGVPSEATSFGSLIETAAGFIGGLFGFGGGKSAAEKAADQAFFEQLAIDTNTVFQAVVRGDVFPDAATQAFAQQFTQAEIDAARARQGRDPITGRLPIPTPQQGGPPLVTERFATLPPIPDVLEFTSGVVGFEGVDIMPVDVPLLAGLLPAVRTVAQPTLQGVVGGLAGGFLSEFLRPIQETGLGTVPMRQPTAQLTGCPTEKPHTRVLRAIKANTGVSINLSRAKSLIRELGLEAAARCLAITAMEACSLLIVASPRRRRGISASDIRIVKRTARRFDSLKHALGHLGGRTTHHHRRRAHAHRHSHK